MNLSFYTHKTARLIAAALKMGCEICELNNEESNQIYKLGLKLGLIFQINDDIIDVTTSQEQSGKPANNDTHKILLSICLDLNKL